MEEKRSNIYEEINYSEVFSRLCFESAIVLFDKASGEERIMFCTRNPITIALLWENGRGGLLAGHDKRCNINNSNMSVIDIALGECRAFNVDRVRELHFIAEIDTREKMELAIGEFDELEKKYVEHSQRRGKEDNKVKTVDDLFND